MKGHIDHEALSAALQALGMLDGASQSLAAVAHDARDEAAAIRAYIVRERPHLLSCYDMEALVELVNAARSSSSDHPAALEQFHPL